MKLTSFFRTHVDLAAQGVYIMHILLYLHGKVYYVNFFLEVYNKSVSDAFSILT